jgi:hypothetical protein
LGYARLPAAVVIVRHKDVGDDLICEDLSDNRAEPVNVEAAEQPGINALS